MFGMILIFIITHIPVYNYMALYSKHGFLILFPVAIGG